MAKRMNHFVEEDVSLTQSLFTKLYPFTKSSDVRALHSVFFFFVNFLNNASESFFENIKPKNYELAMSSSSLRHNLKQVLNLKFSTKCYDVAPTLLRR